jgi:hypothetical protein
MKKLVLLLAVLLCAAPAMATDVTITAVAGPGPNDVTVGFTTANVTELVRAIALDVILDDPNVVISDINCVNADYGIYPGSISIDASGNVTNWGTCAGAGLDSNTVATEQGSLYADGDPLPAQSGDLFIITLDGCTSDGSEDVVVSITEDALRGGVVLEDPAVAAGVTLPADVTVDVGCDTSTAPLCLGDLNGDTFINTTDLGMMVNLIAGAPGFSIPAAGNEAGDMNGDTFVNTTDLGMMVNTIAPAPGFSVPCP